MNVHSMVTISKHQTLKQTKLIFEKFEYIMTLSLVLSHHQNSIRHVIVTAINS